MAIRMSLMEEEGNCGWCGCVPSRESGVTLGECKETIVDLRGKRVEKAKYYRRTEAETDK